MDTGPGAGEVSAQVGSLELPEALLQAFTGSRVEDGSTRITDLPAMIISLILSRVPNPVDVASAFKASRLFWSLSRSVPFRLRLRPSRYEDGGHGDDPFISNRTGYDADKLAAWTRAALSGVKCVMRSAEELDLAGCPILDDDVAELLAELRCLDCLVLDGCQKLTSSVTRALAVSVRSGPRVISLQRCFRLGPSAAGNLLTAAAADGSRLQALLLSHLGRSELTKEQPLLLEPTGSGSRREIGNASPAAGLRILALNNCGNLGYPQLEAISEACPFLEVFMLGGSVDGLSLQDPRIIKQGDMMSAASALVRTTERLSRLKILEITFFTAPVLQAVRDQASRGVHIWDFCDKDSVVTAAAFVATLKGSSQLLCGEDHICGFPQNLSMVADNSRSSSGRGGSQHDIVNNNLEECRSREGVMRVGQNSFGSISAPTFQSYPSFDKRWDCVADDVLMALRAGTNCSDVRRKTPLHVAAASGETAVVANLLSIGAAAREKKDSGGATALFVAAYNGHAEICDHLLRGGADVVASNRTGETPLYIAALRGHRAAVEVMLCHCQEHGINWQDADICGDGWTPLMAATLTDRQDVGKILLRAVGLSSPVLSSVAQSAKEAIVFGRHEHAVHSVTDGDIQSVVESSSISPPVENGFIAEASLLPNGTRQLLDARNRYGQTALHLAARKGSLWFVSCLLHAGASIHIGDEYGLRAVDVAKKEKHLHVERVLKEWEGQQRKHVTESSPASSSSPSGKKKRTKKKKAIATTTAAAATSTPTTTSTLSPGGSSSPSCNSPRHVVQPFVPRFSSVIADSCEADVRCRSDSSEGSIAQLFGPETTPSFPESPTSIVPRWMHSSPPVSPGLERPVVVESPEQEGYGNDGDSREVVEANQDPLGSEASQVQAGGIQGSQSYSRGRATRRRTVPADKNPLMRSENLQ